MNMKTNFEIFFSLCWWIVSIEAAVRKWPSHFPTCYRDDPNLNSCILEATKTVKPFLVQGLPELNIDPIAPFHIPEIRVVLRTASLNYKIVGRNLTIMGLDTYEFDKYDFDVENLKSEAALNISSLLVKGDFAISAKLLTIPLEGNLKGSIHIGRSAGTLQIRGKLVKKNKITYLQTQKVVVKLNIGEVIDYNIEGLFDDNESLAKAAYEVIDETKEILAKPVVEEIVGAMITDLMKKSVERIPYDEVFPLRNNT